MKLRKTFPGEIRAALGERWRVFATNENGVNFTCTEYLGSHPLSRETRGEPSTSSSSRWLWMLIAGAGGGIVLALLFAKFVATRRAR
jgi:hypothetical protein